jgi:hypothetical protein
MREFLLKILAPEEQPRSNAIALVIGLALFLLVVVFRSSVDSKFDVSATDLVLLSLPIVLWLLASGQILSLKFGGLQLTSAIQRASAKPVVTKISDIGIKPQAYAKKESGQELQNILSLYPTCLSFEVFESPTNYYTSGELDLYLDHLMRNPGFKYFTFHRRTSARAFIGAIDALDFRKAVTFTYEDNVTPRQNAGTEPAASKLSTAELAEILNGNADFARIKDLRGFVGIDDALRKSDDTKTALLRMDKIGTSWLPVVERVTLLGFVDRTELAASLILDVANALSRR